MLAERLARIPTFRALRNHNYRLFWTGQLVSLTGTWVQRTTQSWVVLKLTDSPLAVGVVSMLQFTPSLLFGLMGGVLADRFDRRRLLIATQTAAALVALTLGLLGLSGRLTVTAVGAMAFLLGMVTVVDTPTRQSFTVEMVGREDLPNAVALNSVVFNSARIAGPAVAGLLMTHLGFAACFLVNAFSYVPVIAGLCRMQPGLLHRTRREVRHAVLEDLLEGLRYARRDPEVLLIVGLMAVVGTFGLNFNVLLPILADRTLGWDAVGYGLLFSSLGAGSLVGALAIASYGRANRRVLLAGAAALGTCLLLVAALPRPTLVVPLLFLAGLSNIAYTSTSNSTLQLTTPDHLRGRVLGLYLYVFMGTTPLGNLLMGALAERGGAPLAFAVGGAASLVAAVAAGRIAARLTARQSRWTAAPAVPTGAPRRL